MAKSREKKVVVRLTRKFANAIDGIDLARAHVGDRLALPQHDAEMLIAEGWADRAQAADRSTRSRSPRAQSRGDKPHRKKTARR